MHHLPVDVPNEFFQVGAKYTWIVESALRRIAIGYITTATEGDNWTVSALLTQPSRPVLTILYSKVFERRVEIVVEHVQA
jgi:hypothetical protein